MTLPYPGFPTDFLPFIIALNAVADGAAMVTENVFEGRFKFIQELVRLGADIRTDDHHATVRGRERLSGAPVEARRGQGLAWTRRASADFLRASSEGAGGAGADARKRRDAMCGREHDAERGPFAGHAVQLERVAHELAQRS